MILNAFIRSSTSTFNGVGYNDNKVLKTGSAELLAAKNFELMEGELTKKNMKKFFKDWGKNSRVKDQQFHAIISTKARTFTPKQLEEAAHDYVKEMGYSNNPYLVYFHGDTDSNHVHIVSTRVGENKKKVKADFEKIKSTTIIEKIGHRLAEKYLMTFNDNVKEAKTYQFNTTAQFNMLMERKGYDVIKKESHFDYARNGFVEGSLNIADLENESTINSKKKALRTSAKDRANNIKALLHKYGKIHDPMPIGYSPFLPGKRNNPNGDVKYKSDLQKYMMDVFKIEILFHASKGKEPYGYSIIDHSSKEMFKGSEILPLKTLSGLKENSNQQINEASSAKNDEQAAYVTDKLDDNEILVKSADSISNLDDENKNEEKNIESSSGIISETDTSSDWVSSLIADYNAGYKFIGESGGGGDDDNKNKLKKKKKR